MNLQQQKAQVLDLVGELAKAPQNAEAITAEFLMSRLQGKKIDQLPDGLRKLLLEILPQASATEGQTSISTPTKRSQFSEVYSGEHYKLEVRSSGRLGREVRLTINAGASEELACNEINAAIQALPHCPSAFKVYLAGDKGEKDLLKKARVITFTPVLNNSGDRVRYIANTSNGLDNPKTSHEALLKANSMGWVDSNNIRLATGAFRVAKGFPKDAPNIGSTTDRGDLLKGLVARARSGAVRSLANGVVGISFADGYRNDYVVAAGSSPSN